MTVGRTADMAVGRPASAPRRVTIGCLLAASLAACAPQPPAAEPAPVLILSIDTLRSDHLPLYGYEAGETPAIDELGADGIVFERAFAHTPVTLPSHVSLLSGVLPSRHGVRDNPGYRVPDDIDWLPEMLRRRGFATGAAVSAAVLRRATGMDRGFDVYDDGGDTGLQAPNERSGEATVDTALEWIDSLETDLWFLFTHLYEPHRPYHPAAVFADRFDSPYDGEIATADAAIGRLLDGLRTRNLYDGTLIILTSDHGEGLGEHGERDHGVFVYRESLQVPLIVKLPDRRRAGERVAHPVQQIDLLPTIVQMVVGSPGGTDLGKSVLEAGSEERLIYAESYLPRLYYGSSELHTLIGPRLQYIDSPQPELYDLLEDPAGLINLIDRDPQIVELYRTRVNQLTSALEPPRPIDESTRRQLASLGYLGGAAPASADDLPAPRGQLELLRIIEQAYDAISAKDYEEASKGFRHAVELNPMAAFAWAQLSRAEQALGRDEEALEASLMAIRLTDSAPFRLLPAARLALKVKRYEEAADLARRAADWSPAESEGVLSRVALADGNLTRARQHALAALAADATWTAPALQLLTVYLRNGQPQEGLSLADDIEARIDTAPAGLNLLIGEALVQLGRGDEAVEWVEQEVMRFPQRPRAYGYLATLYAELERAEETGATLDRLLDNVPGPARYVTAVRALIQIGFPSEAVALLGRGLGEYPTSPELLQLRKAFRPGPDPNGI